MVRGFNSLFVFSLAVISGSVRAADATGGNSGRPEQRAATRPSSFKPASRPTTTPTGSATRPLAAVAPITPAAVQALLLKIPPADRPKPPGWDFPSRDKAAKFLNERLVGRPFEWTSTIGGMSMTKILAADRKIPTGRSALAIGVDEAKIDVFGCPTTLWLGGPVDPKTERTTQLTEVLDDAVADAYYAMGACEVTVHGTIARVSEGTVGADSKTHFLIDLTDYTITRKAAKANGAKAPVPPKVRGRLSR